jgi:hypothetical protein
MSENFLGAIRVTDVTHCDRHWECFESFGLTTMASAARLDAADDTTLF